MQVLEVMCAPQGAVQGAAVSAAGQEGGNFFSLLAQLDAARGEGPGGAHEPWDVLETGAVAGALLGGLLFMEGAALSMEVPCEEGVGALYNTPSAQDISDAAAPGAPQADLSAVMDALAVDRAAAEAAAAAMEPPAAATAAAAADSFAPQVLDALGAGLSPAVDGGGIVPVSGDAGEPSAEDASSAAPAHPDEPAAGEDGVEEAGAPPIEATRIEAPEKASESVEHMVRGPRVNMAQGTPGEAPPRREFEPPAAGAAGQESPAPAHGAVRAAAAAGAAEAAMDAGNTHTLGQIVLSHAARGGGHVRVHLSPPELGEMHIDVAVRGRQVQVRLEVQNPAAQPVLCESLPQLRSILEGHGFHVGSAEVVLQGNPGDARGQASSWGAAGGSSGAAGAEERSDGAPVYEEFRAAGRVDLKV